MADKPEKPKRKRKSTAKANPRPPHDRGQGRHGENAQFFPTAEQAALVRNAAAVGLPEKVIAVLVINPATGKGIDRNTLRARFKEEIDHGRAMAHFNVGKSLYDQAVGVPKLDGKGKQTGWITPPDKVAGIWYSKAQMGWRERVDVSDEVLAAIVAGLGGNIEALRAARAALAD